MQYNISLLVALKNNLDYTKHFYKTTRALYPTVEICFSSYGSTDGTDEWLESIKEDEYTKTYHTQDTGNFSDNYNKAASLATKDHITFVHNDIVLAPGFLENIQKHLTATTVVSYTTIEPPIFAGHDRPGKIVYDLGSDLESFDLEGLYEYTKTQCNIYTDKTTPGISFFMCMPREVYLNIGGLDNLYDPMFCEDIDLCVRFKLLNLNLIIALDAITYHFVSKTSRFSEEYRNKTAIIERNSNRNFIRKWGCSAKPLEQLSPTKYNIAFVVHNCSLNMLEVLEPWCDRIYIKDEKQALVPHYMQQEQHNTKLDLSKRVLTIESNDPATENDIIVEFDGTKLTQHSFDILMNISDIIKDSGSIGCFELDIYKITITNLITKNLITNK